MTDRVITYNNIQYNCITDRTSDVLILCKDNICLTRDIADLITIVDEFKSKYAVQTTIPNIKYIVDCTVYAYNYVVTYLRFIIDKFCHDDIPYLGGVFSLAIKLLHAKNIAMPLTKALTKIAHSGLLHTVELSTVNVLPEYVKIICFAYIRYWVNNKMDHNSFKLSPQLRSNFNALFTNYIQGHIVCPCSHDRSLQEILQYGQSIHDQLKSANFTLLRECNAYSKIEDVYVYDPTAQNDQAAQSQQSESFKPVSPTQQKRVIPVQVPLDTIINGNMQIEQKEPINAIEQSEPMEQDKQPNPEPTQMEQSNPEPTQMEQQNPEPTQMEQIGQLEPMEQPITLYDLIDDGDETVTDEDFGESEIQKPTKKRRGGGLAKELDELKSQSEEMKQKERERIEKERQKKAERERQRLERIAREKRESEERRKVLIEQLVMLKKKQMELNAAKESANSTITITDSCTTHTKKRTVIEL